MSAPDDPHADDRIDALLDTMRAGDPRREDPFARELERLLDDGGPIPVDERDAEAVVERLLARLDAAPEAAPVDRTRPWMSAGLAVAAAVTLAAVTWWWLGSGEGVVPEPEVAVQATLDPAVGTPVPAPAGVGTTDVQLGDGTIAEVLGDTVVLVEGVVSVARTDPRQTGAHKVRISGLDLVIEPVGTVFDVGTRGDTAAVRVREGRVRLLHDAQGHLGELAAGGWAVIRAGAPALQVDRVPDGPIDPVALGLSPDVDELLADMRWLALPPAAREAILTTDHAP